MGNHPAAFPRPSAAILRPLAAISPFVLCAFLIRSNQPCIRFASETIRNRNNRSFTLCSI
jgi:hypothetical protein